jgi:hypothetical protein
MINLVKPRWVPSHNNHGRYKYWTPLSKDYTDNHMSGLNPAVVIIPPNLWFSEVKS